MATQMEFTQVFKIGTGMKDFDEDGNDELNYASFTLLADTATKAIEKAEKWFRNGEFLVSIEHVCEVRLT